MTAPVTSLRSMLFTPADKPDRASRIAETRPDCLVVDLEDGVGIADKASARAAIAGFVSALTEHGRPAMVLVRVNAIDTEWFGDDIAAVGEVAVDGVVVPKVERDTDADTVRRALGARSSLFVVAGIESAAGVASCEKSLGRGAFDACYFGAEDFITDMGGVRTPAGNEVLYARSRVALAARLGRVPAVDQIVSSYRDDDAFRADARLGRQIGVSGKLCIHPAQVALAHEIYRATEDELIRARHIVDTFENSAGHGGVVSYDGQMIDAPMLTRARALLARATA